jgi:hypothetical protein
MVTYTETVDPDYLSKVQQLDETLSKHTTNYDILCIIHTPRQNTQSFTIEKQVNNNITLLHLNTFSISHGVFFLDESDNIFLVNIMNSHFSFDIKNIYDDEKN